MSDPVDGIVLAGTYAWSGAPFERLRPRPLLPVAQAPLISYSLRWMAEARVRRLHVCLNEATRALRDCIGDGSRLGVSIEYHEDASPRGAAGCVRDVAALSDAHAFLIADATVVPTVERDPLLASHQESGAALTVVVHRDDHEESQAALLSPAGIYLADRSVFDHVAPSGFQDIKENLVPRLHGAGRPVRTHLAAGCCPRVVDARSYLTVSHWMLCRLAYENGATEGWSAVYAGAGEVLAHPTAWVDPGAKLLGPVLLGPGVRVKDGATIVGPTSIGADSVVEEGAVISRTIAWERCVVNANAFLDACVLADDAHVSAGADLCGAVVTATAPRPSRSPRETAPEEAAGTLLPWTLRQGVTPGGDAP